MDPESSALLRRVSSRALRAASRAWAATMPFRHRRLASPGFSSSQLSRASLTAAETKVSISGFRSFSLGWLLNVGLGSLTLTIATSPSRRSSPVGAGSFSFRMPAFLA